MQPRKKIEFTIPGFRYPDNGGFPCFAIEEINWAIFDAIMLDNAKSHLAHDVNVIFERTVRGSFNSGKRPYISYEGVEYRNEAVSISTHLVGTKLLLEVNPDDISSVLAYTEDGVELGYLRATGIWERRSHSLKTRKEALKYIRKNKSENSPFFASLIGYENEL